MLRCVTAHFSILLHVMVKCLQCTSETTSTGSVHKSKQCRSQAQAADICSYVWRTDGIPCQVVIEVLQGSLACRQQKEHDSLPNLVQALNNILPSHSILCAGMHGRL